MSAKRSTRHYAKGKTPSSSSPKTGKKKPYFETSAFGFNVQTGVGTPAMCPWKG